MKELLPHEGLRVYGIKDVTTAGPSPNDNIRTEVFLLGCDKAMKGNPCIGCFNSCTWDKSIAEWSYDPVEYADYINSHLNDHEKYVTIGGGEPTDQLTSLIPFVKRLKEHNIDVLMYTYHDFQSAIVNLEGFATLMQYIDGVIDGEFVEELKIWTGTGENKSSFVGSSNQRIWKKSDIDNKFYSISIK